MQDNEEETRVRKQRQALQTGPTGALLEPVYVSRTNEVVGVTRSDLDDLLQFDGVEFAMAMCGQFFLAGAAWLFIERWLGPDFKWDLLSGFCFAAMMFGLILLGAGMKLRSIKRTKIRRIFGEDKKAHS